MLLDACVDMCVRGLFEIGIHDVAGSYGVLELYGGGWDGRRLCAVSSLVDGGTMIGLEM